MSAATRGPEAGQSHEALDYDVAEGIRDADLPTVANRQTSAASGRSSASR